MRARIAASILAFVAPFVACGIFPDVEGLTGGDAASLDGPSALDGGADGASEGGANDGSTNDGAPNDGASSDASSDACMPGKCCNIPGRGPMTVNVGAFCIDSTEVTQAQYAAFLADAGVTPKGIRAECSWNTSLEPRLSGGCLYDPAGHPNLPVSCVDWCDAVEFCAWAGKRLCGAVAGGSVDGDGYSDASASQWTFACSEGGKRVFPYGNDYDGTRGCNGADAALGVAPLLAEVGTRGNCVGGYSGLFDMSGNVWEWIDSCETCDGGGRCCASMGGGYGNSYPNLQCIAPNRATTFGPADYRDISIGFRCCTP